MSRARQSRWYSLFSFKNNLGEKLRHAKRDAGGYCAQGSRFALLSHIVIMERASREDVKFKLSCACSKGPGNSSGLGYKDEDSGGSRSGHQPPPPKREHHSREPHCLQHPARCQVVACAHCMYFRFRPVKAYDPRSQCQCCCDRGISRLPRPRTD